jgi:siroheme synthase-like protein
VVKVATLLRYGAKVSVVSPRATKRLAAWARAGRIRLVNRRFRPSDMAGAWLIYAATDDAAINRLVYQTALKRRIFANVVDQPSRCTFIAPAIFQRGPMTVAVSTGGASPSLAKRVRSDIGRSLGADYVPMLRLLRSLRGVAKRRLPSYGDRKRYFSRLVDGRVFALIRAGRPDAARREALSLLKREAA